MKMGLYVYVSGVSLRLRHARDDVGALLERWELDVGRSWIAGTPRTTPKGGPLQGKWPDSYAYSRLDIRGAETLVECLRCVIEQLQPLSQELNAFVEGGGRAELFVHWHLERNSGAELDRHLLRKLVDLGLDLSLDIYPEVEPEMKEMGNADA